MNSRNASERGGVSEKKKEERAGIERSRVTYFQTHSFIIEMEVIIEPPRCCGLHNASCKLRMFITNRHEINCVLCVWGIKRFCSHMKSKWPPQRILRPSQLPKCTRHSTYHLSGDVVRVPSMPSPFSQNFETSYGIAREAHVDLQLYRIHF